MNNLLDSKFATIMLRNNLYKEEDFQTYLRILIDEYFATDDEKNNVVDHINASLFSFFARGGIKERVILKNKMNLANKVMDVYLEYAENGLQIKTNHLKQFNGFVEVFVLEWMEIVEKTPTNQINQFVVQLFEKIKRFIEGEKIQSIVQVVLSKTNDLTLLEEPTGDKGKTLDISLSKVNKATLDIVVKDINLYNQKDFDKIVNFVMKKYDKRYLKQFVDENTIDLIMLQDLEKHKTVGLKLSNIVIDDKYFKRFNVKSKDEAIEKIRNIFLEKGVYNSQVDFLLTLYSSPERINLTDSVTHLLNTYILPMQRLELGDLQEKGKHILNLSNEIHLFNALENLAEGVRIDLDKRNEYQPNVYFEQTGLYYSNYHELSALALMNTIFRVTKQLPLDNNYEKYVYQIIAEKVELHSTQRDTLLRKEEISDESYFFLLFEKIEKNVLTEKEIDFILEKNSFRTAQFFQQNPNVAETFISQLENSPQYDFNNPHFFKQICSSTKGLLLIPLARKYHRDLMTMLENRVTGGEESEDKQENIKNFLIRYFNISFTSSY